MNSLSKKFVVLSFLMFFTVNVRAAVKVFAQVDSEKDIYVGESFTYHIIIDGENQVGLVDLAPLAKYNPRSMGNRDVSQTSISIINGKTTRNVVKRFVMSYSLVSNQTGRIELSPVKVTVAGESYQTNPVSVNILKPGTTDKLDIEVTLSEQRCYVGQPVLMTINFYFSADISDPQFNIPAFNSNAFYLENPDTTDQQAKEFDLGTGVTVMVTQHQVLHKGQQSNLLVLRKILVPKTAGNIQIEPSEISADVAVGRSRSRDPFFDDFFGSRKEYKRFMVSSQPLNLTVSPLPEENQPSGFYGLVGRYTISASASPVKVGVGDPITLTISIGGDKYLKPVKWPDLEAIPEMADNFKIPSEKASPTIDNGFKIFTQTIRANNDKVDAIPAIPLAFFDADKGSFNVAETKPIKLDVSPTKVLTQADLEGTDFAPVNKEVEAVKKGLSANYEALDALTNQTFSPLAVVVSVPYLLIWAGPLVLLIASSLIKFFTYTTPEKVASKRRRSAAGKAISQLRKITSCPAEQQHELLASTMKQYIGDRFDKIGGSLTSNDCFETVAAQTKDRQIADKYKEIVAGCEAARYAFAGKNLDGREIEETIRMIKTIEKKSRK